jgi:hypothetical protein
MKPYFLIKIIKIVIPHYIRKIISAKKIKLIYLYQLC